MKKLLMFFYLLAIPIFSQEKITLKNALETLSEAYKISFSYNDASIQKSPDVLILKEESLAKILLDLSNQTHLVFEKIDTQNYILRPHKVFIKTICGTVLNAVTKENVPFVTVSFDGKSILTDSKGYFEIENIASNDFITINSLEYQPKKIEVSSFDINCITIFLEEAVYQLNEVAITNYLARGFSKKKDGSIVLDPKNLGILPGVIEPDVLQVLQLIPGVQSPDETASGLYIRGSTPDQNLVLYDGMKMYNSSHFFGLISAFNPYITSGVKLYRSGTHAKYGNNVGGVLDIDVTPTIPKKTTFGFGSTFTHLDAYIKTPVFKDKVGLIFSARRSITDIVNSITFKKYSEVVFQNSRISDEADNLNIVNSENDFYYEDYHGKIIVQPNLKNKISFSYLYNLNDLKSTGNTIGNREEFEDDIAIKNTGFKMSWKYGFLEKGTHKIAYSTTNFDKDYEGSRETTLNNGDQEVSLLNKENKLIENSLDYLFEKTTSKGNRWQLGYQYNHYDVGYNFSNISDRVLSNTNETVADIAGNHALFTEYQYRAKSKWLVNLGVRLQRFGGLKENYIEPRLNVNYKIKKNLNVKFSTELKHQSIAQVTDFRNDGIGGLFSRYWILSDGEVSPVLKSIQASVGIDYKRNKWFLDIDIYKKSIDGVLLLVDDNTRGDKYFNGNNTVVGLDVLLKKKWGDYNTWLSYSLSKSEYQFKDLNNSNTFDGSYDTPHSLIWSHNYEYKKIEFSLGYRLRSGIPYTVKTATLTNRGLVINNENLNTRRLPNYQRVDFSASYKFYLGERKKVKGTLGLTIQNVTNKENILDRDYEIQRVAVGQGTNSRGREILIETDRVSIGFVPNMVFRLSF